MVKKKIAIVGAGVTGLAAAYRLKSKNRNFEISVFETKEKSGGKIATSSFSGLQIDEGADAFLVRSPWAIDLFNEIGLSDELISPAARNASVWCDGKLIPLPSPNILGIPLEVNTFDSQFLNPLDLKKIEQGGKSTSDLTLKTDFSIGEVVRSCVGNSVFEKLVDPLLGGINAGNADEMSCATMAPQLLEAALNEEGLVSSLSKAQKKIDLSIPIFNTHKMGVGHIIKKLAEKVEDSIQLCEEVISIKKNKNCWLVQTNKRTEKVDAVILATPAPVAAKLLNPICPDVSKYLFQIEHASVSMVTFAFAKNDLKLSKDQSGFLVPRSENLLMTACSFSGNKWPHLDDGTQSILRVSTGRIDDERHNHLSDQNLVKALKRDLEITIGVTEEQIDARVTRWPKAMAQFAVGHLEKIENTTSQLREETPGISIAGSYHYGVGIPACIRSGSAAALSVCEKLENN